jgi:uncharacterized protein (DUF433 family)
MATEVSMVAQLESLTPAEVAIIAGVSVRDVHRVIDEQILPDTLYSKSDSRSLKSQACVLISFYFQSADRLTAEERQRTIAVASASSFDWKAMKDLVRDDFLTIDLAPFRKGVDERLQQLRDALEMVVSDEEILGGTPVISGTRVPVYDVAASVAAGISFEAILSAYPSLNRKQVELAALYAEASPLRGRPKQRSLLPSGAELISSRRKDRSAAV